MPIQHPRVAGVAPDPCGVPHGGAYINYLAPGILVFSVASGCEATAINLVTDMSEGIIARFRTMAISRASVLTGQVVGSLIWTMVSVVFLIGVALLGYPWARAVYNRGSVR